jgi:hypothetical protein
MSEADIRQRAASGPSETDIAFAKAVKTRRVGPDPKPAEEVPPMPGAASDEQSEVAALREQVAALRSIVMSQRAPTTARRAGDVADAELAAEACGADLKMALDEAAPRGTRDRDGDMVFVGEDREKINALRAKLREMNQKVDIARALAGEIPRNHPGLKYLPADHPVFRVR